jgi:prefoldin subunit 5
MGKGRRKAFRTAAYQKSDECALIAMILSRSDMQKILVFIVGIGLLLLANAEIVAGASHPKVEELNRKITEMASLQRSVTNQIDIAIQTREQLQKQIDKLVNEINQEMVSRQIDAYPAAEKIARVKYNIKLIQLLSAYIDRLNQREQYFRTGNDTLEHLQQQVNDDLQLLRTLNDMQVDELIHEINTVLDEYIPETQKAIFTVEDIRRKPPEKIWGEIVEKN